MLSVAIISYNGRVYLERTLPAVSALGPAPGDLIVVDGGSTDGSVDFIRREFPGIRLFELKDNPGPGTARNLSLKVARCDRVLLLDGDVIPEPGCGERLNAALDEHPAALLAVPAVLDAEAPSLVQYLGAEPHFLGTQRLLYRDVATDALPNRVFGIRTVPGSCMLIDRSRFGDRPWFDERLFFYFEDHEFGLRAAIQGFELLAVPAARCRHGAGTIGISIRQTGRFTPTRIRYTIRNRWLTILMLYRGRTILRLFPALAAFELFQFFGAVARGWLHHWGWALGSAIRSLPDVRRKRAAIEHFRRVDDFDLLAGGSFPYNPAMHRNRWSAAAARVLDGITSLNWRLARFRYRP